VLVLFIVGAQASGSAMAGSDPNRPAKSGGVVHEGPRDAAGGHRGGVSVRIAAVVPLYRPSYYPLYNYPMPTYVYPASAYVYPASGYVYPASGSVYPAANHSYAPIAEAPAVEYVQQGYLQAPSQQDWFFCADYGAYYPNVRDCPSDWQRVPSQPPR
jgi:hypothetical protein